MIACVDVHYREGHAVAACVLFRNWTSGRPVEEFTARFGSVAPYEPGRFVRRELDPLLEVLRLVPLTPRVVVVDGYVWLDGQGTPGLGAFLYRALGQEVAVVGVAKSPFRGSPHAVPVCRGGSSRPLFVTAAGMPARTAAASVLRMHGKDRIPTMIRLADRLCRSEGAAPDRV